MTFIKSSESGIGMLVCQAILLFLLVGFGFGCATSRSAGIQTTIDHINAMEKIADNQNVYKLSDSQGVALLSLSKYGAMGLSLMGWSGSVYVKDPVKNEFGPPIFINAGGLSIGVAFAGINAADCLIVFKDRKDAIDFASRSSTFNFTHEASFIIWGSKAMHITGGKSYSDGAMLSVGAIELDMLFGGGPRDKLHANLYQPGTTIDKIVAGDVVVPDELKSSLAKLNTLMKR